MPPTLYKGSIGGDGLRILTSGVFEKMMASGEEARVRYGFVIPRGDPRAVAELAGELEAAGWDGAFYWDGINIGDMETYDPWVVMAAMAMRTGRVRIGAMLPPARRRPWKLARETMTLDRLSGGRLVLPVGLGTLDDGGFSKVGEPTDRRVRARLLDESLDILTGLWSGEPFSYEGGRLEEMTFLPRPVQRPRIPIWVVGAWPSEKSMNRALRYDGLLAYTTRGEVTPEDIRAMKAYVEEPFAGHPLRHHLGGGDAGRRPRAGGADRASVRRGGCYVVDRVQVDSSQRAGGPSSPHKAGAAFHRLRLLPSTLAVFEDLEDLVDERFALVGEIAGVNSLLVRLEVAEGGLLRQVLVYETDDGVNLLSREAVAAAGQSAPHGLRPSLAGCSVAADYTVRVSGLDLGSEREPVHHP